MASAPLLSPITERIPWWPTAAAATMTTASAPAIITRLRAVGPHLHVQKASHSAPTKATISASAPQFIASAMLSASLRDLSDGELPGLNVPRNWLEATP
jgi:hypothetical protein